MTYQRVHEHTLLRDEPVYVVIATWKDGDGDCYVKHGPTTWDECDDYAQRNESPDNAERYYVAEVID